MKKLLTGFLALVTLLTLAVPARADILWWPDDSFLEKHAEECVYEGRSYYANGEEGFVTLWNAPDEHKVEEQFENGTELWVGYLYEDWGCVSMGRYASWVPLADLQLIYDHISFEEEYADRITPYNGEFADYEGDAKRVNFYTYPGADEAPGGWDLSKHPEIMGKLTGRAGEDSYIQSIFVDENGLTWGFVGYMYGHTDAWFCLDEPDGEGFPLREVDQPELIPARTPVLPAIGYMPYLLVGAVVLGTGLLLALLFRKKRKK